MKELKVKRSPKPGVIISTRLNPEQVQSLQAMSAKEQITVSAIVRKAILRLAAYQPPDPVQITWTGTTTHGPIDFRGYAGTLVWTEGSGQNGEIIRGLR